MRLRRYAPTPALSPSELAAIEATAALPEESNHFSYVETDVPPGMRLCDWRRYTRSLESEAAA